MLVLSRKPGECLQMGDDIRLTVVSVKGNRVRIGIEAPPSVRVLRCELQQDFETATDSDSGSKALRACLSV